MFRVFHQFVGQSVTVDVYVCYRGTAFRGGCIATDTAAHMGKELAVFDIHSGGFHCIRIVTRERTAVGDGMIAVHLCRQTLVFSQTAPRIGVLDRGGTYHIGITVTVHIHKVGSDSVVRLRMGIASADITCSGKRDTRPDIYIPLCGLAHLAYCRSALPVGKDRNITVKLDIVATA